MDKPKKSPEQYIPPHEKHESSASVNEDDSDDDIDGEKPNKEKASETKASSFFNNKKPKEENKNTLLDSKTDTADVKKTFEEKQSDVNSSDQETMRPTEEDKEPGLSEAETHTVVEAIVDDREKDVAQELSDTVENSPEEFEAIANAMLLDEIRSKALDDSDFTEESLEQATSDTLSDLTELLDIEEESIDDVSHISDNEAEITDDTDNDVDSIVAPVPPVVPVATPPSPQPGSTQNSGGSTPPPIPPMPPTQKSIPGGPLNPGSGSYFNALQSTPYRSNNTVINNTVVENYYINRRRRGRDMLVGGIIGYMIGRRGGRKRTEKKLIPHINKLEKEVGVLHDKIAESEDRVRIIARQLAEKHINNGKNLDPKIVVEKRKKRLLIQTEAKKRESIIQSHHYETVSKSRFESLGIFREKRLMDGTENSPKRIPVEVMTPDQLAEKLKGAKVDGILIFDAYLSGRLSLDELRIVAKHYMRGGPYESTFRSELKVDPKELEQKRSQLEKIHSTDGQPQTENVRTQITQTNTELNSKGDENYSWKNDNSLPKAFKSIKSATVFWPLVVIIAILIVFYLLSI